jgi:superfamily II DNA or RNA helicase
MHIKLYKHQQSLVDINPDKWLLAWEVGTGKTYGALSLLKNKALVIVPKSLKKQWEKEKFDIDIYTKEEFKKNHLSINKYKSLLIDEAHYFSGMQGLRKKSAMLKSILTYIKKHDPEQVFLLTGTPYLSTPWNIYALAEILGYKWDYKKFKEIFFSMINMGRRFPVPVINKNVIWNGEKISSEKAISILDVPEQTFQEEYFDLTKEQCKAIDNIEDVNPIVKWTAIHQICGGTLKSDGYTNNQLFKSEKMNRVIDLANEHNKVIVVCRYNHEIEIIYNKLIDKKINTYIINGKISDKDKVIESAERSDNCIVLINAACSEGYELPSFPLMVFYSYSFSLKDYIQIKGRIQRLNKIKKNVYLSLVVKDTIDEDVYKNIKNKESFDIEIYDKR